MFSKISDFSDPEILKAPLDQTLLQLKSIGVEDLLRFPYVTKPPVPSIQASMKKLTILGALKLKPSVIESQRQSLIAPGLSNVNRSIDEILQNSLTDSFLNASSDPTDITELGRLLSKIPIDPKFAKMLVVATKYELTHYAIMMVACMSVQEIFDDSKFETMLKEATREQEDEPEMDDEERLLETQIDRDNKQAELKRQHKDRLQKRKEVAAQVKKCREEFSSPNSELITYCKLLSLYFNHINSNKSAKRFKGMDEFQVVEELMQQFCNEKMLLLKSMKEVHYLCLQLEKMLMADIVKDAASINQKFEESKFDQPSDSQEAVLQQVILSAFIENFSRKAPIFDA